jgi:hypothetical protein
VVLDMLPYQLYVHSCVTQKTSDFLANKLVKGCAVLDVSIAGSIWLCTETHRTRDEQPDRCGEYQGGYNGENIQSVRSSRNRENDIPY